MRNQIQPLECVRVVELATFIAATSSARFLADLGAAVVKVEAFVGDALRYTAVNEGRPDDPKENISFDLDNANKRGICLNLKTDKGLEAMHRLLAQADVFITNWRPKALQRAGLDYETLKNIYPKLVFASVTGYGEVGPDKDLPGFDYTAFFARGGILGTMKNRASEPMLTVQGFGDHQAGMNLSAGILAALYRAKATGQGDKVSVSLLHSAIWDISILLQSSQYGHPSTQFPLSRDEMANPLQLAYRTKDDRWLQIAIPSYDLNYPKFVKIIGYPDLAEDERYFPQAHLQERGTLKEFYQFVVSVMAKRTVAEWSQLFTEADIPFAKAQTWDEVLVDEQAWASGCFVEKAYSGGAVRTLVRPPVRLTDTVEPAYERGPYLGEHTQEVLREYGYTDDEIFAMLEQGVAKGLNT